MATKSNGKRFCKVVYTENGRNWQRKVYVAQSAKGKLRQTRRNHSHEFISFNSSVPKSGEHLVEMLLSPTNADPFLSTDGWLSKRDVFVMALTVFLLRLIRFLAEEAALALH